MELKGILSQMADYTTDAIVITKARVDSRSDGPEIVYVNKSFTTLTGYTPEEAIGRKLTDLIIPPEMCTEVEHSVAAMMTSGHPIPPGELSLMRKDGSRVDVISSHAIVSVPDKPSEMFCVDIDISSRKKMEAELEKYRDHLETLVAERTAELADARVRQALNYATDKKAIVNAVFMGSGTVAKSPIPPNMLGFNKDLKDYSYDPEKAKALLKQAGLEKGAEVTLWSMPVQRPYNPNSRRIAEMIQSDWAKVGVKAKIVSYEWGEYLSGMRKGEHDSALFGWMSDNGDPDNFLTPQFSCAAVKSGTNFARYCDKTLDGLISQGKTLTDQDKRSALYQKAQAQIQQQALWLPLAHPTAYALTRKDVQGYQVSPFGRQDFSTVSVKP